MTRYSKMIVALIGAVGTWAATYFPDNHRFQVAVGLASALATVASVYLVPNTPPAGQLSDPTISEQDPPVARRAARRRPKGNAGLTVVGVVLIVLIVALAFGLFGTLHSPLWLLILILILAVILL